MNMLFGFAVAAALALVIVVAAMTFHKVRRIHLATYAIAEDARTARREAEALFGQLHAWLSLERLLALPHVLPPMRGWAGSPDMLLQLATEALTRKPRVVVECSSGVSTVVLARCLQLNGAGHVYSLEHDPEYAQKSRSMLQRYGLDEWATVFHAPLREHADGALWYDDEVLPPTLGPVEMLVVDGPPAATAPQARYPALPRLMPRMAPAFTVMLDDADRPDEQAIVKRWREACPHLTETRPPCEKGLSVLRAGA